MKIKITSEDLGEQYAGEYELVAPSVMEHRLFRIAAGIGVKEWSEIVESGGIENGALAIFATLLRAGKVSEFSLDETKREELALATMRLPGDLLAAIFPDVPGEGDAAPPASKPAASSGTPENAASSGSDS